MRLQRTLLHAAFVLLGLAALWVGIPAVRVVSLAERHGGAPIHAPSGLLVQPVQFSTSDGVLLKGWLVPGKPVPLTVVLVPGFKTDRMSMIPYARFLHAAGYQVLLYDSRGTGESDGKFSFGFREVDDVLGAIRFAAERSQLVGLLGVSMGTGDAIVAAARDGRVKTVVADSPYVNQSRVVDGLDHLRLGPLNVPLAPIAGLLIDRLAGTDGASFQPIASIARIPPRGVLLIHARYDANPTTPLSDAVALRRATGGRAELWLAPKGGHAEALAAQPEEYRRRVLRFFARYLR
jgi:pimeloyl-ACP methyl ester carboxylesterase